MFVNVHTHDEKNEPGTLRIYNLYKDFHRASGTPHISVGIHPWYISLAKLDSQFEELQAAAEYANVMAIGECGLDKVIHTDWNLQLMVFEKQVRIAEDLQKPIIVHCVKSINECIQVLKGVSVPVIFHGINQKFTNIESIIRAGYYLSFGKVLLSKNQAAKDTFERIPLEQLFLETDDASDPICSIYESASILRNLSMLELNTQLLQNFNKVFSYHE